MAMDDGNKAEVTRDVRDPSRRLEETEQTLHAIRRGAVDALVVSTPEGDRIVKLQGAEHPYRVMVEAMEEGAVTLSQDGTILYCNRRFSAMLGLPLEKVIGSQMASHLAREDHPLLGKLLTDAGQCARRAGSLITGGGKRLQVLISSCKGELPGGATVSLVMTDPGAGEQAECTIVRLNKLYAVLSATNHAIVHAGSRGAIFHEFCRVAVDLGGFRLAWVAIIDKEKGVIDVAAASGEIGYLDGMAVSIAGEDSPLGVVLREGSYYICNDLFGDELTRPWRERARACGLQGMASVAIKQDEEVVGALTVYTGENDFFDAQQVELLQQIGAEVSFALDKLHQTYLRNEAEQALQDETVERLRAVEELRKKEQLLIHQSRQAALGEMVGNIAHQWRQPLNALAMLVQQAPLYYSLGEMTQQYMDRTAAKSMELINHMSRTIDDFRNFFKPNKEKVVFSVREEVSRTLSLMEGSFYGQVEVEVEVQAEPDVNGYPSEFCQALLNILINARDALRDRNVDSPKVVIAIAARDDRAQVTITDNAGGVPEEIIDRIFDPYFTTKGPHAGTGVGLFMSKTIIEKNMGGSLTVRNTGTGAKFTILV